MKIRVWKSSSGLVGRFPLVGYNESSPQPECNIENQEKTFVTGTRTLGETISFDREDEIEIML